MNPPAQKIQASRPDRHDLLSIIRQMSLAGTFVEVGTYRGHFAEDLMVNINPAKLFCVDPYESYAEFKDAINFEALDDVFTEAKNRVARFGHRVEFLRVYSKQAAEQFPDGSLDLVYIDGNHRYKYALQDIELWYPKVRQGGLVCGDDAIDGIDDPRNEDGDVVRVWTRNERGEPVSWGHYGVQKAVRDFTRRLGLQYLCAGNQFLIPKTNVTIR